MYDRIARRDVLAEAWGLVRRNKGSAGVDAQTIAEVERYGVERFLEELHAVLCRNAYRPQAVLRRYIPKADGKQRPLGIPTVRDRVVQAATNGNASVKFTEVDRYVAWRLKRMRLKRKGRHLRPGEAQKWSRHYFYALGLHRLHGTVRYPEAA
jgi:hypothetical protein